MRSMCHINLKKKSVKIGAACLAILVAAGSAGTAVHAGLLQDVQDGKAVQLFSAEDAGVSETVYVIAENNGTPQRILVADGAENTLGETENGELPVTLSVTYTLDGTEMLPEELAGRSGHVVIRYAFDAQRYEMAEIEGKQEKIYVPFAAVTGMVLDHTQFQNVSVSQGRVIDDGSRYVVIGIAFPGVSGNLQADVSVEIPDFIEIEADVTDFELGNAYTIVTNEIFNCLNLDDVTAMDELKDSMDELTEAMDALMEGSSTLYDGLQELHDKSNELTGGVKRLKDGSESLAAGADSLAAGASELSRGAADAKAGAQALQSGASQLSSGLGTLASKNGELTGGAAQVFQALLDTANTQLAASGLNVPQLTMDNYSSVLNGVLASMGADSIYNQVYAAVYAEVEKQVNANEAAVRAGVTQAVREQVLAQVLAGAGYDRAQYEASAGAAGADHVLAQQIDAAVDAQMQTDGVRQTVEDAVNRQKKDLIDQQMQSPDVQSKISQEAANIAGNASAGAAQIAALKAQLDSYNTFYQGLIAYTQGVSQANAGAGQLSGGAAQLADGVGQLSDGAQRLASGAETLSDGAEELKSGIDTLSRGCGALVDGVKKLRDGALQLRDGLVTFNEEGIGKLTSAFDDELDELFQRLRATVHVSRGYRSFDAGAQETGNVRFIYKMGGIK